MIRVVVLGGAMAGLLFSGAAQAQTAAYTWTGYGRHREVDARQTVLALQTVVGSRAPALAVGAHG